MNALKVLLELAIVGTAGEKGGGGADRVATESDQHYTEAWIAKATQPNKIMLSS